MPGVQPRSQSQSLLGLALLVIGESGAWAVGNLVSTGYWIPAFLPASFAQPPYDKSIAVMVSPLIVCAVTGTLMM